MPKLSIHALDVAVETVYEASTDKHCTDSFGAKLYILIYVCSCQPLWLECYCHISTGIVKDWWNGTTALLLFFHFYILEVPQMFVLLHMLAISCRRHSVLGLSMDLFMRVCMHACVHDYILKVCEHSYLQTACGNFTKWHLPSVWFSLMETET